MPLRNFLRAAGALLAVALVAGCGGPPVVAGKVVYKGQPVTTGEVSLIAGGKSRSGLINSDGRYEIIDPPTGEVTVVVTATRVEGGRAGRGMSPVAGTATGKGPSVRPLIPVRYADPATSGLRYAVGSGRQTYDIELAD